jgi:hypothetical protein
MLFTSTTPALISTSKKRKYSKLADDVVMGGRMSGNFAVKQRRTHGVFSGEALLENNGGFVRNGNGFEKIKVKSIQITHTKGDGKD